MTNISDEVRYFARCFSQGILDKGLESYDDLADRVLQALPPSMYPSVAAFLDSLLGHGGKPEDILADWNSLPSDIYFSDAEKLIGFLKLMRARISTV